MLLIKNGFIVKGENELEEIDILVDNDVIVKMEKNIKADAKVIDAKGCLVMPGAVDVHVHFREPGFVNKETIKTGTESSAKGGFTAVMPMPNLNPCPDNYENLKKEMDIIEKDAVIDCYPYGTVTVAEADKQMADIEAMAPYVKAITDDGRGVNNLEILEHACRIAKKFNLVVASHAEDNFYKYAPEGEFVAVRREIEIAKRTGVKYHFCHMSTKESFDAIRQARKEGYKNITCEITPHHLVLSEDMIKDGNWKMNPPLRSKANMKATIEALLDGTADMIACDHAPHTEEEKSREYDKCPNGIIGIETSLPIIYTEFVKTGLISYKKFLDLTVYNPNRVFNLGTRDLKVGEIADIAILDIENPHTYTKEEILSKGKNSPFIGNTYYGFTKYTIKNGKAIYKK
ncbi:MAG: dihydroorotase [Acholeplasmatales bacterium]|nr:dihydroorotase [Acholeplasmatales bacterium]